MGPNSDIVDTKYWRFSFFNTMESYGMDWYGAGNRRVYAQNVRNGKRNGTLRYGRAQKITAFEYHYKGPVFKR